MIAERDLKPKSRDHYLKLLENHIIPKLGDIVVSNLKPDMIRAWYSKTLVGKPTYRAHAYQVLHGICVDAVRDQLLDRNPCMIKGASTTKRTREPVVPDIDALAIIADKIEPKFRALVLISAWCGLRFGEAIELRRKDFNADCSIVTVARGVIHRTSGVRTADNNERCVISTPTSGKGRNVVVPPHIRSEIKAHLDEYVDLGPESLLFVPVRGGCHVSDRVVRDAFRDACSDANVSGMRLHDMRHFAGHQTARVANLPETMSRLGHSTSTASLRYQGQVSGRDVEIADALSALATTHA